MDDSGTLDEFSALSDYDVASAILDRVRLRDAEEESCWHHQVADHCHVWGEFYGPATSKHLARVLAHRFMDRQGADRRHMLDALRRYGGKT